MFLQNDCSNWTTACVDIHTDVPRSCCKSSSYAFRKFVRKYAPVYRNANDEDRSGMLQENLRWIASHNNNTYDYKLVANKFAADTPTDVEQRLGSVPWRSSLIDSSNNENALLFDTTEWDRYNFSFIESAVDWSETTTVQDQGRCACSWAMVPCSLMESAHSIVRDEAPKAESLMSYQEILSCNGGILDGCNDISASMRTAFDYINENAVETLEDYEFVDDLGTTTRECRATNTTRVESSLAAPTDLLFLTSPTELVSFEDRVERLKRALTIQPVAAIISADCLALSLYGNGVLTNDCSCSDLSCLNHAVLVVGYDDTTDVPHWLVQNSWGDDWGEGGFFRVSQVNPTGDINSWGLFGILSELVTPITTLLTQLDTVVSDADGMESPNSTVREDETTTISNDEKEDENSEMTDTDDVVDVVGVNEESLNKTSGEPTTVSNLSSTDEGIESWIIIYVCCAAIAVSVLGTTTSRKCLKRSNGNEESGFVGSSRYEKARRMDV